MSPADEANRQVRIRHGRDHGVAGPSPEMTAAGRDGDFYVTFQGSQAGLNPWNVTRHGQLVEVRPTLQSAVEWAKHCAGGYFDGTRLVAGESVDVLWAGRDHILQGHCRYRPQKSKPSSLGAAIAARLRRR